MSETAPLQPRGCHRRCHQPPPPANAIASVASSRSLQGRLCDHRMNDSWWLINGLTMGNPYPPYDTFSDTSPAIYIDLALLMLFRGTLPLVPYILFLQWLDVIVFANFKFKVCFAEVIPISETAPVPCVRQDNCMDDRYIFIDTHFCFFLTFLSNCVDTNEFTWANVHHMNPFHPPSDSTFSWRPQRALRATSTRNLQVSLWTIHSSNIALANRSPPQKLGIWPQGGACQSAFGKQTTEFE